MRNAGVQLARQRLLRYRLPQPWNKRWRNWVALAFAGWAVWALFLSDHSVARLLQLQAKEKGLVRRAALLDQEIATAKRELPGENPSLEEAELLLRGRHFYARKGEMIYVY